MRELDFEFTPRRSNKWAKVALGLGFALLAWPAMEIWHLSQEIDAVKQDIQRLQAAAEAPKNEDPQTLREREERKRMEALLQGTLDARLSEMEHCFGNESATLTAFQHDEVAGLTTVEARLAHAQAISDVMSCLNAGDLPLNEPRWALRSVRAAQASKGDTAFDVSLVRDKKAGGNPGRSSSASDP